MLAAMVETPSGKGNTRGSPVNASFRPAVFTAAVHRRGRFTQEFLWLSTGNTRHARAARASWALTRADKSP